MTTAPPVCTFIGMGMLIPMKPDGASAKMVSSLSLQDSFIMASIVSTASSSIPYLLAFAAGAMIYVVVEELIPESQTGPHSNVSTIGVAIGFVIMMILDVTLG